ncbi:MAG: RNA polymerase sigma factor [Planctomycetota bacterium]|jgi:RNA polymerase sigma-70 factor (ECF subfamily)|nr:sigma-70 family RNA polymerase sigma factor [Blastopirellula sp.]
MMQATIYDLDYNSARQLQAKEHPVTDEQLLQTYRQTGDREAFALLVYRYERELYNYLRRYLGNAEMAEDVFQATFLLVHRRCDQFHSDRKFRPWLYTIATNQAIDARRRTKRHKMLSLDTPHDQENDEVGQLVNMLETAEVNPLDTTLDEERKNLIRSSLEQLPEQLYSVVQLVYYQGMKYREAAEVLGIPVGTVKSRVHAAVSQLGQLWNSHQLD